MHSGKIWVAKTQGVYILRLTGDIRLNLSAALDRFIETMFTAGDYRVCLIDLSGAEGIDSTMLGLLAKISIMAQQKSFAKPGILSANEDINRILSSMGFEQIFYVLDQLAINSGDFSHLPSVNLSEEDVKSKVLEAHKILMGLNESNRQEFQELVDSLDRESDPS